MNRLKSVKIIQKRTTNYLGRKSAFMYTHGYNKAMRSLIGNFPKHQGKNETYKRAKGFRTSLIKAMKPLTDEKPIYRGLSGVNAQKLRNIIESGNTSYNKNSFSSFTRNFGKSLEFADKRDPIILMIKNPKKLPGINYGKHGFNSMYTVEKEILIPPGRFTVISKIGGKKVGAPYTAYVVKFTRRNTNISNLEKRANALPKISNTPKNNRINMNAEWRNRWTPFESNNQERLRLINEVRSQLPTKTPKIKSNVLNYYSKNNPRFKRYEWKNILRKFIQKNENTGRRIGKTLPTASTLANRENNSKLISKKFAQQVMAYYWNKMTNAEKAKIF